jgi:hypothetical protein
MSEFLLPRVDSKTGTPYMSYSQYTLWKDTDSFNLKTLGKTEYMIQYFFGKDFGDQGWAQFGTEVEDYICNRESAQAFSDSERETLEKVIPLGNYQVDLFVDMGGFSLKCYIDDSTPDLKILRDYKTGSKNSVQKYYKEDYDQVDLYAGAVKRSTGVMPELIQVVMVERKGNCMFGGGREKLTVGNEIWNIERTVDPKKVEAVENRVIEAAKEISKYYGVFLKLNKNE